MDRDERSVDTGTRRDDSTADPLLDGQAEPRLLSRVLVTWIELTVVGITGGLLGATIGGPVGFIVFLVTTLLTTGIILYNVNELVKGWVRATRSDPSDLD